MLNRENRRYWCMIVWQFDFILLIQGTGEWNGLIKQIQDHRADMVLTSLKITPKRSEVVDFSIPFLETGITIMVSIRKGNISPTAFLGLWSSKFSAYPFPIQNWIQSLYTIVLKSILKMFAKFFNLTSNCYKVFGQYKPKTLISITSGCQV